LVASGDLDQGIELLRKASDLSQANPEIQLHLASALVQKGDNLEEAKVLVQSLQQSDKLKNREELAKLREQLGLI
jgi:thioredoxin-like negative regulator of GroEL